MPLIIGVKKRKYVRKRPYRKPKVKAKAKKMPYVRRLIKSEIRKEQKKTIELKRRQVLQPTGFTLGQVNVNTSGYNTFRIEHSLPQGVGYGDRIGRSVLLTGMYIRFSIQQQSQLTIASRYRVEVWKSKTYFSNPDNFTNEVYESDGLSGFIDGNSTLNLLNRNLHTKIASKMCYLQSDQLSGVATLNNYKMFIKQRQKLEWSSSLTAPEENIFYYVVLLAYQGNKGGSASSVSLIPLTQANTGAILNFTIDSFYVDA